MPQAGPQADAELGVDDTGRGCRAGSIGVGYSPAVTEPLPDAAPPTTRGVEYKGAPLDGERGPGLGCFRFQLIVLAIVVVLTPLSVAWNWPPEVSAVLLFVVLGLLLLTGQTIIFLLRLVAADRRAAGRRRPLASQTRTVGELEDADATGVPDPETGGESGPS